ncbi:response regulator [Dyadobacter sp. CY312]|uniref:response regulator n=1 Tax=Dyadobacter sp. CY312 TaxID=2907303 RepID=UPI001F45E4A2|nr:response regulator [Dyadobacter sp. CY312]MCE7039879.1 response regulator [Dyadobacter sp. CY312]
MERNVLIIDDEKNQAEGLTRLLTKKNPSTHFFHAFEEKDILHKIETTFFNLAIVDLRMDGFDYDGVDLIGKIITENPFARIIVVSAFTSEFTHKLNPFIGTGKILAVSDKKSIDPWSDELTDLMNTYFEKIEQNPSEISNSLLSFYSKAKNESDTYLKGKAFEHFVTFLLGIMGFREITHRVIDRSRNEVDLLVRNDISDTFLGKFGKYILVECKNYPADGVGKNAFIEFLSKLKNTNGLAELGILFTTGYIAQTTYIEAVRTSTEHHKIIFISNPEIEKLINSSDIRAEFKKIIDSQVKDN